MVAAPTPYAITLSFRSPQVLIRQSDAFGAQVPTVRRRYTQRELQSMQAQDLA